MDFRGEAVIVKEGEEDNAFWNVIGGKESYYTGPAKKVSSTK